MMLGKPSGDRRALRHAATRAEILDAAWQQVRENGLAALSLRDLARTVGMQPPSLYSYFASKHDIYDAMFAQGAQQFIDAEPDSAPEDPVEGLRAIVRLFVGFCAEDPARYQLLFQRTVPGFEPSPASYELARRSLGSLARQLDAYGISDPAALDLFTALVTGLADQQISNDPGGDRWLRLADDAVAMFHAHVTRATTDGTDGRSRVSGRSGARTTKRGKP